MKDNEKEQKESKLMNYSSNKFMSNTEKTCAYQGVICKLHEKFKEINEYYNFFPCVKFKDNYETISLNKKK